jgi:F plasmid transfer operon protein TraF
VSAPARAQSFDAVGTRAAGMGGAFVAVADDASAAYWNPAGFAAGSLFGLVLDRTGGEVNPPGAGPAGNRSGLLMAIGVPALGLSYYRLSARSVTPATSSPIANGLLAADTLVTHHAGVTLVQSVLPGVAVGATLKMVRGSASSVFGPATDRDALLDQEGEVPSRGTTRFDADLGVMASAGKLKAGLTLRNASQPSFRTPDGARTLRLEREARAGVSLAPLAGWIVAADSDILENEGPRGPSRRFAAGTEARVYRRAVLRGGFSLSTTGERARSVSAGGSFAATTSLFLDVQMTRGSDPRQRGWGVAARFGY